MAGVVIFTDGACKGNNQRTLPRQAGYCILVMQDGVFTSYSGKLPDDEKITNNRAELYALCAAGEYIAEHVNLAVSPVTIYSDSDYSIKCIYEWYPSWVKNKKEDDKLNIDLISIAHKLLFKPNIIIQHVRAHQTVQQGMTVFEKFIINGNNYVDAVATNAAYYTDNEKIKINIEREIILP